MNELNGRIQNCQKCSLWETRNHVVVGVGNEKAEILFIGEAPGENEDNQGEPFVGRGGKLLDQLLAEIGLSRKTNIYIANIVKCRPPKNRDPLPIEQEQCISYLYSQIEQMNPKIIVCLGRVSAKVMIKKDIMVTKEHGKFFEKEGRLYMATLHPAAILRNPKQRVVAEEDFLVLKEKIQEICVSTKFESLEK